MFSHRPWWIVLAVLLLASSCVAAGPTTAPAAGPSTQPADRTWLIKRFDQQFLPQVQQTLAQPANNAEGAIAWGLSYQMAALVEMLDATRDPKYADLFVKLGRFVVDARDDKHGRKDEIRNRTVKGWSSVKYSDNKSNKSYVWAAHTGMIIEPMARFAALVLKDATLKTGYRGDAVFFLQTAIECDAVHEDQFRQGPGPDEGYLFDLFLNKHLPLNQQNALARAWIWLADATGDGKYVDRTRLLARFFKNRIRTTGEGAYVWEYWPPLDGPGTKFEDISHAAVNADFMVLCAERGIVFNAADLVRLEKTFLTCVLIAPDKLADTLEGGSGTDKYRYAPFFWARLAGHSFAARERLVAFCRLGATDRTCSPSEALGLALLAGAFPPTLTTAPAGTQPATQPATRAATQPASRR